MSAVVKNVYSFDSIVDEVRAKHRPDFVDSRDLHPPLPDESTCATQEIEPAVEQVDGRITPIEWCLFVAGGLLAIFASILSPLWITP